MPRNRNLSELYATLRRETQPYTTNNLEPLYLSDDDISGSGYTIRINNPENEEQHEMTVIQKDLVRLRTTFCADLVFTDNHPVGTFCFASGSRGNVITRSELYVVYEDCGSRVRVVNYEGCCARVECATMRFFVGNDDVVRYFCNNLSEALGTDWCESSIKYALTVMHDQHEDIYNSYVHLPVCAECGNPVYHRYSTFYGTYICSDCAETRYYSCNRCGTMLKVDDIEITRNGARLCPNCSKRLFVLPYHRYYPKIQFYGDSKCNSEPYMGFELEVDFGGESDSNVAQIMPIINKAGNGEIFAYCSHDGSLTDGLEIITQPATLRYHQSIKGVYNDMAQKLKSMGYSSHDTTTCGFHVHVNRDYFGDKEKVAIERVILIVEKFWNEMCIFARRPERRMERYSKKRPTSISIDEYMERADKSQEHDWHYYAVNIANRDTIEFRMFKGTLNVNTIMATLNLVENICKAAKCKTAEELNRMKFEDFLTTPLMRKYYARHACVPDFEE